MKNIIIVVLFLISTHSANAVNEIVRGPYLQDSQANSILIRWRTKDPAPTIVKYQLANDKDAPIEKFENLVLTVEHQARIKKLQANKKYFYKIYDKDDGQSKQLSKKVSKKFYFYTNPLIDDKNFHAHIWILGDPGTNGTKKFNNSDKKSQLKVRDAYYQYREDNDITRTNLILTLGDNAYWSGKDEEYQRGIFIPYQNELVHTPIFTVFGNHDGGLDFENETYTARAFPKTEGVYFNTFYPGNLPYYSFDYATIHFIVLDSFDSLWEDLKKDESNYEKIWSPQSDAPNAMLQWLENDLSNNKSTWTIVAFHHPPFFRGGDHPNLALWEAWIQANIAPILDKHKVDLVLTGHIHNYQRSYPLKIEKSKDSAEDNIDKKYSRKEYKSDDTFINALKIKALTTSNEKENYKKGDGTIYVVLGSSGAAFNKIKTTANPLVVYGIEDEGSLILDIDNERLQGKFLSKNKKILDKFTIDRHSNK